MSVVPKANLVYFKHELNDLPKDRGYAVIRVTEWNGFCEDFRKIRTENETLRQQRAAISEPLSNDDISKLWGWEGSGNTEMIRSFARAIEKAHGIQ